MIIYYLWIVKGSARPASKWTICSDMLLLLGSFALSPELIGVACREPTSKCWPGSTFVEQWCSQAGFLAKALPRPGGALPTEDQCDLTSTPIGLGMVDTHRHIDIHSHKWTYNETAPRSSKQDQTNMSKSGSLQGTWVALVRDWGTPPRHVTIMGTCC